MNTFEENRLGRVEALRRERSILLGHKLQANILDFLHLTELQSALTDEIIQVQNRIQALAQTAASFKKIDSGLDLRGNFQTIRTMPLVKTIDVSEHIRLSEILGNLAGAFLNLDRCLLSYKECALELIKIRNLLAPSEVEEFQLDSGDLVTVMPVLNTNEFEGFEILAFTQSQSLEDLANGAKTRIRPSGA